jgi:TetR/AcrR family acrAB operon transcriptional repressor
MRRTKEDAELTRQAVLDAALQVMSRRGYAATRLEDIARAAKVTRGAIYHYFPGKPELFAALVDEAVTVGDRAVARAIAEGGDFLVIAERVLRYTLDLLAQDGRFRGALALLLFSTHDSPDLAPLRRLREAQGLAQLDQIVGFFKMGIQQGSVRPDLDPDVAARAFLAYQNGLVLLWLSSPGIIDVRRHAAGLATLFVHGIASD